MCIRDSFKGGPPAESGRGLEVGILVGNWSSWCTGGVSPWYLRAGLLKTRWPQRKCGGALNQFGGAG
eukprot:4126787-Prorocentrum_lima.AAC.1